METASGVHQGGGVIVALEDSESTLRVCVSVPGFHLVEIRAPLVPFGELEGDSGAADARGVAGVDRERAQVGRQPVADDGETVRGAVGEVSR